MNDDLVVFVLVRAVDAIVEHGQYEEGRPANGENEHHQAHGKRQRQVSLLNNLVLEVVA